MSDEFSTWLAQEMEQKNLNASGLALKMGVSHVTIGRWLRAEARPRDEHVRRLARLFQISPDQIHRLLGRLTEPPNDPYFEVLETLWKMTPEWKKKDVVNQLRLAVEEYQREQAEHKAQRETEELIEADDN